MTTIKTIMIVTIAISKQKEKIVGIEDVVTWAPKYTITNGLGTC